MIRRVTGARRCAAAGVGLSMGAVHEARGGLWRAFQQALSTRKRRLPARWTVSDLVTDCQTRRRISMKVPGTVGSDAHDFPAQR
jgi:hypothetical protein